MAEYSTYQELIDRDDANDLDAILSVDNHYVDAAITTVADGPHAIFTWDYEKGARPALNKLYEKAKRSQWNGETDLDWSIEVDPEELATQAAAALGGWGGGKDWSGTPFAKFGEKEWRQLSMEGDAWTLSQFLHG